jgi:hypothetical protein
MGNRLRIGTALALGLAGCGEPSLRLEDLFGEWEFEACTWGAAGTRQMPCTDFRPIGTVEFGADSTVTHWLSGKQSYQKGRIVRMEFEGQGGVMTGQAQNDPRLVEAEIRLQEGTLVYTLTFPGGPQEGMHGMAEHGVLRRK